MHGVTKAGSLTFDIVQLHFIFSLLGRKNLRLSEAHKATILLTCTEQVCTAFVMLVIVAILPFIGWQSQAILTKHCTLKGLSK